MPCFRNVKEMSARLVDIEAGRYPHSIVWSPLPGITWFLPFIGHVGITDKEGIIYDFGGPYTVNKDSFTFGAPTRYYQLDLNKCRDQDWDVSIQRGCELYSNRMHNICCDNCHSMVARCLNNMAYGDTRAHSMVSVACMLFFRGKYVSFTAFIKTWLPFIIVVTIVLIIANVLA
jgi:transmembrane protein 222